MGLPAIFAFIRKFAFVKFYDVSIFIVSCCKMSCMTNAMDITFKCAKKNLNVHLLQVKIF